MYVLYYPTQLVTATVKAQKHCSVTMRLASVSVGKGSVGRSVMSVPEATQDRHRIVGRVVNVSTTGTSFSLS